MIAIMLGLGVGLAIATGAAWRGVCKRRSVARMALAIVLSALVVLILSPLAYFITLPPLG